MNLPSDGGPAFPQHGWSSDPKVIARMQSQQGLSLLDYFAAKAMAAFLSHKKIPGYEVIAAESYRIARIMVLKSKVTTDEHRH